MDFLRTPTRAREERGRGAIFDFPERTGEARTPASHHLSPEIMAEVAGLVQPLLLLTMFAKSPSVVMNSSSALMRLGRTCVALHHRLEHLVDTGR